MMRLPEDLHDECISLIRKAMNHYCYQNRDMADEILSDVSSAIKRSLINDIEQKCATLEQQLRNMAALVEKKNEALHEVRKVFETPDHPGISDTVWVVGNRPETLYDCTLAAIDLTADDVELVEVGTMLNGLIVNDNGYLASLHDLSDDTKLYAIQMKGK